jgi:uncharacterized protein (DUF885 family)
MRKHFPVSHTIKRAAALLLAAALLTSGAACKKKEPTAATRPADVSASAAAAAKTTEAETSAKEKAAEKITQELTKPAEAGKTEETAAAVSEEEKKKVQEEFDEFCDRIFAESLETNLLTTHFLLEHPETYGIDISEPAYPDVTPTTKEEDIEELEPDLETCRNFDENLLTDEQKLTRRMLLDALETDLTAAGLSLYYQPLNPLTGLQNQLPVDISEYRFDKKEDIDASIRYVELMDSYFEDIIKLENAIADAGLAPDDAAIDRVIESCKPYLVPAKENVLVTSLPDKLEAFGGLTDEEKKDYENRMEAAVTEHLIPAYKNLSEAMEELKGRGKNHGGLSGFPQGKEYFTYFINSSIGADSTPEELEQRIRERIESDYTAMGQVYMIDPNIYERVFDAGEGKETPEEMLDYLKDAIKGHFPDIGETGYVVKYVPESLKDIMSPAFFFIPTLDGKEPPNSIYINSASEESAGLFTTLAHEGYPGHLYQSAYFRKHGNIPIRYLMTPTGYAEGWGLYCQLYGYRLDDKLTDAEKLYLVHSESASMGIYAYLDLMINYSGWDIGKVQEYLKNELGLEDRTAAEEIFYAMVDDPGNYLLYYTGYLEISDMYDIGQRELGKNFSEEEFHRFILDMAGGSFRVIKEEYGKWLRERK